MCPFSEHMHRIFMTTKTERWIDSILMTQQANPLVTKLEEQTSSRNSRAVVKDPSLALFSKEQNNRFFCKHPGRRPLKETLHCIPLRDFNRHILGSSRKIWGNARLVLHRVSEKPNNNYFSVKYVKGTPLLADLWKILRMVGEWNSGLCCLTMTTQSIEVWPLSIFCWILIRLRGRNFGRCEDWYVIMLYKAFVRSQLEYASSVWYPYKKHVIEIENLQGRATKFILELKNLEHPEN